MTKTELIKLAKITKDLEMIDRLSRDEDEDVRYWVARNRNASAESLNRLSRDKDKYVRRGVALNPNTPIEILDQLSRDEYGGVREVVAENPKWQLLQESGLLDVARLASKWLNIL